MTEKELKPLFKQFGATILYSYNVRGKMYVHCKVRGVRSLLNFTALTNCPVMVYEMGSKSPLRYCVIIPKTSVGLVRDHRDWLATYQISRPILVTLPRGHGKRVPPRLK
jgi:hypothetical protein